MNDITSLFNYSELAFAAYGTFEIGPTSSDFNVVALTGENGAGMSLTQATEFALRYPTVVTQFNDTDTGFSVTVFKDANNNLTVAFRGTNEFADLLPTGADIRFAGAGYDQIAAMVNWWAKASAAEGQTVQQFSLATYSAGAVPAGAVVLRPDSMPDSFLVLERAPDAEGIGGPLWEALQDDTDGRVDLTGHSLGGHLAMAFSSIFAVNTGQAVVFNAPGFIDSDVNRAFFQELGGTIPTGTLPSGAIVNVAGDEALVDIQPYNWIAGMNSRPGTSIDIAIEKQTGSDEPAPFTSLNHSITALTDSLAVYRLLKDLDPDLSYEHYKIILNQASMFTAGSLERIVDALESVFGLPHDSLLKTGNGNREVLYQAIYGPEGLLTYPAFAASQLQILPIVLLTPTQQTELAYRYALHELNPFVVFDPNDTGLYARYQTGGVNAGELDFYGAVSNPQGLTESYLQDRAAFLERKLYITGLNRTQSYEDPTIPPGSEPNPPDTQGQVYQGEARHYEDRASGFVATNGSPNPNSMQHFIFGGAGADILLGATMEDHLYGGRGPDFLQGKGGDDYLEGGLGLDSYRFMSGDGLDMVLDADGRGLLLRDGNGLFLGVRQNETQWSLGATIFTRPENGRDLEVTFGNADKITVKDFDFTAAQEEGYLGIRLINQPVVPQDPVNTYVGDVEPDTLEGSTGNEVEAFITGGGDDVVFADGTGSITSTVGGADYVLAGPGRDFVAAGGGDDWVEGSAGGDVLLGGSGNDVLYADASVVNGQPFGIAGAITAGETGATVAGIGDFVSGGVGRDVLIGAPTSDFMAGGGGEDVIIGGAGDDNIFGDGCIVSAALDWQVTRSVTGSGAFAQYAIAFDEIFELGVESAGADLIYGGAGDDWIFAGGGDDIIDGGLGQDLLFGEAGADILLGGSGNDVLVGDNPGVVTGSEERNDYLDGGDGNDILQGNGGDDILIGGRGNDSLFGGAGKDVYFFNRGDGADTLFDASEGAEESIFIFGAGFNPNSLTIKPGSLVLDFGDGDEIHITSFDVYDPTSAPAFGSLMFDDGTVLTFEDVIGLGFDFDGTEGNDSGLIGTAFNDRIRGHGGNDILIGLQGADALDGGAGNDQLFGDEGNDILNGDAGSDWLIGGDGDDQLRAGADQDSLWGGMGNDVLEGGDGNDRLFAEEGDDYADGGAGVDQISGGEGADTLNGGGDRDFIHGDAGDDILLGGGGGDELFGGDGNDLLDGQGQEALASSTEWLYGGLGDDTYIIGRGYGREVIWDRETWNSPGGTDTVRFVDDIRFEDGDIRLARSAESYWNDLTIYIGDELYPTTLREYFAFDGSSSATIEYLLFASNGSVLGVEDVKTLMTTTSEADDNIIGFSVDDVFHGLAGNDTLIGLDGNDSLFGDAGDDQLHGLSGDDFLSGGTGNDFIVGGDGDDTLDGGAGYDEVFGADGIDVYQFAAGHGVDTVSGVETIIIDAQQSEVSLYRAPLTNAYDQLIVALNGTLDRVIVPTNFSLLYGLTEVANICFSDGSVWDAQRILSEVKIENAGTESADLLFGTPAADYMIGNGGDDILDGGAGDDIYLFNLGNGVDRIIDAEGFDTLLFGLGITPEMLTLGLGSLLIRIGATGDAIHIEGFNPNDVSGSGAIELFRFANGVSLTYGELITRGFDITGAAGDDVLVGTDVKDRLAGLAGNDTYFVNDPGDLVVEAFGEGTDTVISTSHYVLGVNVENLILTGNSAINGTGNSLGNAIIGNDARNVLNGGDGNDTLDGGSGDDTLNGATGNNTYQFGRGGGKDLINSSSTSFPLPPFPPIPPFFPPSPASFDTLQFLQGIQPSDVILEKSGTNLVFKLNGSLDQIAVNNWMNVTTDQLDLVKFDDGTAWDVNAIWGKLPVNEINGTAGADKLTGTPGRDLVNGLDGDDVLVGLENPDTLIGGVGNDSLAGGAGNDVLDGGAGDDTYLFSLGDAIDVIWDKEGMDIVRFGVGITSDNVTVTRVDDALLLSIAGTGDQLAIHWQSAFGYRVESVQFSNGTIWNAAGLEAMAGVTNAAPVITIPLVDQAATEDEAFVLDVSSSFSDPGDTLSYTTTLADGSQLPAWLTFNRATGEFSGIPTNEDIATHTIVVTASDSTGLSVSDTFELAVLNVNDSPELVHSVLNQSGNQNAPFRFVLPEGMFVDVDAEDSMTLSAAQADGSPLPAWLSFDSATGTFAGTPSEFDTEDYSIRVTATDRDGATAFDDFGLSISDASLLKESHVGTVHGELITTGFANDLLDAGGGDDLVRAGAGRDTVFGGIGHDELSGEAGNDWLYGGIGHDRIDGGAGDDILSGGMGHDFMETGSGDNLVIAGPGHDTIAGGSERDVFMANLNDGRDTLLLSGATFVGNQDVLSLGGGIEAGNIFLRRDGADLLLEAHGVGDKQAEIALVGWFDGADHQTVTTLQLVGADGTCIYDFKALVELFDADSSVTSMGQLWSTAESLPAVLLAAGSEPIGGDIAQEYANTGVVPGERAPSMSPEVMSSSVLDGTAEGFSVESDKGEQEPRYGFSIGGKRQFADRDDSLAGLLEAYLAQTPHYAFEAYARELGSVDWNQKTLAPSEIARRWQGTASYFNELLDAGDENARSGVDEWRSFDALGLRDAGTLGSAFSHAGSAGLLRNVADLKSLKGLNEGFDRLRV